MIPLRDDNPTDSTPVVTIALIVICVLAFLWQQTLGQIAGAKAVYSLGVIPAVLFDIKELPAALALIPAELTIFSSMFLHGGWMHLIGNMLYLWIFGDNIEDTFGRKRFFIFYLLCGIAAALAQTLMNTSSEIPMIGASGAISGVLGAYLLLYPRAHVLVVIPLGIFLHTTRLPAMVVLGFWFVIQLVSSFGAGSGGGVAFMAHVGGFVAGMALMPLFRPRARGIAV